MKRVFVMFVGLVFIFCLVACRKFNLEQYKENKKDKIYVYVETLDYKEYNLSNWRLISKYVATGISDIDIATDKCNVDNVFEETILKIKNIDKEKEKAKNIFFENKQLEGSIRNENTNLSKIILNYSELVDSFKDLEVRWINNPIWDNYSEEFFKDKAIIFCAKMYDGSNIKRHIDEVCINNETIKIHLLGEMSGETINCDYFCLPFIIEVNKKDINNINNIEFIEKYVVN